MKVLTLTRDAILFMLIRGCHGVRWQLSAENVYKQRLATQNQLVDFSNKYTAHMKAKNIQQIFGL